MFPARFIRLVAVLVAMVGFSMVLGGNQALADHQENGVCHAIGNGGFIYIEPAEVSGHLDDNEDPVNPGGQSHDDDRAATRAEFEAGECLAQVQPTVTNTPVPPTATTVPVEPTATTVPSEPTATTAPGQPTATTAPGQPAPTTVAVQALPETGASPSEGNQAGLLIIAGSIAVLLFSGATWAATRARR